jgi:hypothetical protein
MSWDWDPRFTRSNTLMITGVSAAICSMKCSFGMDFEKLGTAEADRL